MTETPDGWPEKYRDPRDRPHPEVLRITVQGLDTVAHEIEKSANAATTGEEQPAVVSFESVDQLRTVLTDRRLELLQTLLAIDGAPDSISALADDLDRNYRSVHDDVSMLADYGIVFLVEEGQSKRPYLPYKRIHIDVEFGEDDGRETSVPA